LLTQKTGAFVLLRTPKRPFPPLDLFARSLDGWKNCDELTTPKLRMNAVCLVAGEQKSESTEPPQHVPKSVQTFSDGFGNRRHLVGLDLHREKLFQHFNGKRVFRPGGLLPDDVITRPASRRPEYTVAVSP